MESPILLSTATTKAAGKKAAIGKRDAAGRIILLARELLLLMLINKISHLQHYPHDTP
jgi:hypothetical protein